LQRVQVDPNFTSFLAKSRHVTSDNPNLIKVYPLVMNGELYVCAATQNQSKQVNKFRKMNINGVGPAAIHEPMHLLWFKKPIRAIKYIRALTEKFKITGARDAIDTLKSMPSNFFRPGM